LPRKKATNTQTVKQSGTYVDRQGSCSIPGHTVRSCDLHS